MKAEELIPTKWPSACPQESKMSIVVPALNEALVVFEDSEENNPVSPLGYHQPEGVSRQLYHLQVVADLFFSFPIVVTNFSCLIALAKTSNVVMDKGSGRGHPRLVANFKGKTTGVSAFNYK